MAPNAACRATARRSVGQGRAAVDRRSAPEAVAVRTHTVLLPPLSRVAPLGLLALLLACSVEVNGTGPLSSGTEILSIDGGDFVPEGAAGNFDTGSAGEATACTCSCQ